jgi:hypothetical protein
VFVGEGWCRRGSGGAASAMGGRWIVGRAGGAEDGDEVDNLDGQRRSWC